MTRRAHPTMVLAALGLAAVLGGCGDPRLKKLTKGISRDSVIAVMGLEKPHRLDPYLVKGQYIEALYYAKAGADPGDSIPDRKMSPVVVIDGKLVGWGWSQWDSIASANGIVVAK